MRSILYFVAGLLLLAACEGFRFNCPTHPETAANVVAIYDEHFGDCGFDGAVLSWNVMEAPDSHISCLGKR